MAFATQTLTARISLIERIQHAVADMAVRRKRSAIYARTRTELESLTNRELADIGLSRGMIDGVARDAARLF